jgi:hypothetical protein
MLRREKRQVRRILVSIEGEIKLSSSEGLVSTQTPIRGVVTNLSTSGLSMRLPDVYPIGTMVRVFLTLNGKQNVFYASVRRVYPSTAYHPSQFGHGLQIVAAAEEAIDNIYEYIMTVTGRAAMIETANVLEAFPATVNAGSTSTTPDPPLILSPATSPEPTASPG